jgi:hypothetical protein
VFYVDEAPEGEPASVTYCTGEDDFAVAFTKGGVRHGVVEQYLRKINEKDEIPLWFIYGQAARWERFFNKDYISWSVKEMRRVGGFIKLKQYFEDSFVFNDQGVYQAGLLCAYLVSNDVTDNIKACYDNVIQSIADNKKISREFGKLQKALMKEEKVVRKFESKH